MTVNIFLRGVIYVSKLGRADYSRSRRTYMAGMVNFAPLLKVGQKIDAFRPTFDDLKSSN